jgi:hypothetical protein
MLKTHTLQLTGRDVGTVLQLTELPALVADRRARTILQALGEPPDGGIVTLAYRHLPQVRKLGDAGLRMLNGFVDGRIGGESVVLDQGSPVKDWRNIEKIQQQALYLHTGFILDRDHVEVPVSMIGDQILHGGPETRVTFCSPLLAAVLESKLATYHELETVYSTEDVYNLQEISNVRAIRNWHDSQRNPT